MVDVVSRIKLLFTSQGAAKAAKETETVGRAQTRLGQASASAGRQFSAQASGMGGLVMAYAGAAANIFAITMAFNALAKAARAEETIAGTRTLAAAIGESGDLVIAKLQDITQGQVSMAEASEAANLALSAGFSSEQIEGLALVAIKASKALGRDLTDSLNRLVRGAAKVEPEILDELGIIVRLDKAVDDYAEKIGKAASQLTLFERSQAFTNAIITQGTDKFSIIDEKADSSIKTFEQLSAQILDLAQQIGGLIAGALGPVVNFITGNFLNTLSVVGILGGLVFAKLGDVASGALINIGNQAQATGIRVSNYLGAGGAARGADQLTKSMQGVKLNAKSLTGQLIGMSRESRTLAIQLLQQSKTTRLTATELRQLNTVLLETKGTLGTLLPALNATKSAIAGIGLASRVAAVSFKIAGITIGIMAKGFNLLIGALGKGFFIISMVQLITSTLGKFIFGVDLLESAGEKIKDFFSTWRSEGSRAQQAIETVMAILTDMPGQMEATFGQLSALTAQNKGWFWGLIGGEEFEGEEVLNKLRQNFLGAFTKLDISELVGAIPKPGTIHAIQFAQDLIPKDIEGNMRTLLVAAVSGAFHTFESGQAITAADVDKLKTRLHEALLTGITDGFDSVSPDAIALITSWSEEIMDKAPNFIPNLSSAVNAALEAGLSTGAIEQILGDGFREGLFRFSDDAQESMKALAGSPAFESLKKAVEIEIGLDMPPSLQGELAMLFSQYDKHIQLIASGTLDLEKHTAAVANQDKVYRRLQVAMASYPHLWRTLGKSITELQETMIESRPAAEAYASTMEFLNKSFDIKNLGKFRELIDGTGQLATTARGLKEAKWDQLGAMLDKITTRPKYGPMGMQLVDADEIARARKNIGAAYADIVKGVDKQRFALEKVTNQYEKQLALLTRQIRSQALQNQLQETRAEDQRELDRLELIEQQYKNINEANQSSLNILKARVQLINAESNAVIQQIQHQQTLRQIEFDRQKASSEYLYENVRRTIELRESVADLYSNLYTTEQIQEIELQALRVDVSEARQLWILQKESETQYVVDQKAIAAERRLMLDREDALAKYQVQMQREASRRQEDILNRQVALEKAKIGEEGTIEKEFGLEEAVAKEARKTADINAKAAHADREITLMKMKADAAHLLNMATLLDNHPQALHSVFEQHAKSFEKTMEPFDAGTAGDAIRKVVTQAQANFDKLGKQVADAEGGRSGFFKQSDAILNKQQEVAKAGETFALQQLKLDKQLRVDQAKQAIINLQELIKREEERRKELILEVEALDIGNEAKRKAIKNTLEYEIAASQDRILAAKNEVLTAQDVLKAQKQLNDYINNPLLRTLDLFSGALQDRVGTTIDDLIKLMDEGTLTMETFKETFRLFLIDILTDLRQSIIDEFVKKPITEALKEGIGVLREWIMGKQAEGPDGSIDRPFYVNIKNPLEGAMESTDIDPTRDKVEPYPPREVVDAGKANAEEAKLDILGIGLRAAAMFGTVYALTGDWKKAMVATFIQMFLEIAAAKAKAYFLQTSGGHVSPYGAFTNNYVQGGGVLGIQRMAAGGGALYRDRVPALLEPGEFVIRKPIAKAIGGPALQRMNATGETAPPVTVNLTNKGTPQKAEASEPVVLPAGVVVDIVLTDLKNNGPIKQSLRSGGRR